MKLLKFLARKAQQHGIIFPCDSGLLLLWDSPYTPRYVFKNYFLSVHMYLWTCFLRIRQHQEEKVQISWTQWIWLVVFNSVQFACVKVINSMNKISGLIFWLSLSLNIHMNSSVIPFSGSPSFYFWPHITHFPHSRQRNHLKTYIRSLTTMFKDLDILLRHLKQNPLLGMACQASAHSFNSFCTIIP